MSFEGAVSSLGKTRDADGTVDRVQDPPQKLWAVLAAFKYKCEVENIEIISIFEVRVSHATPLPAKEWARARWQMRPLSLSQRASGGEGVELHAAPLPGKV